MVGGQFLTVFHQINGQNSTKLKGDSKEQQIIDFINASYQGSLNASMDLHGVGTVIDDEFNFITCSNWRNGKMNGSVFIKLINEAMMWGEWRDNMPFNFSAVKMGKYSFFIPYKAEQSKISRPKKCLVVHEGKQKVYLATIQRNIQGVKAKRQYFIAIEKIVSKGGKQLSQMACMADMTLSPHEDNCISFLGHMQRKLGVIRTIQQKNGYFITTNFGDQVFGSRLGILLDRQKLTIKTVGMFSVKKQDEDEEEETNEDYRAHINGLALLMTMQGQKVIGVFKEDMLVDEMNTIEFGQSVKSSKIESSKNERNTINQMLRHEHMRSLNYQHTYIYFAEIKKILSICNELNKYVEMFERLSDPKEQQQEDIVDDNEIQKQDSLNGIQIEEPNNNVFLQNNEGVVDKSVELKVNLKKEIYHKLEERREKPSTNSQINPGVGQQNGKTVKKPGFITNRSQISNAVRNRSPSTSPNPKAKAKFIHRTPSKNQNNWKV